MHHYRKPILYMTLAAAGSLLLIALLIIIELSGVDDLLVGLFTDMEERRSDGVDDVEGYGLIISGTFGFFAAVGAIMLQVIAFLHLTAGGFSLLFALLSCRCAKRRQPKRRVLTAILSILPLSFFVLYYGTLLMYDAYWLLSLVMCVLMSVTVLGTVILLIKERKYP